jgi:hypothetical protein
MLPSTMFPTSPTITMLPHSSCAQLELTTPPSLDSASAKLELTTPPSPKNVPTKLELTTPPSPESALAKLELTTPPSPESALAKLELTTPPSPWNTPTHQPQQQKIVRIMTTTYNEFGVQGLEAFEEKKRGGVGG